jgi:hypothetical protein
MVSAQPQSTTQATQQLYTHAAEPKAVTQRKAKVSSGFKQELQAHLWCFARSSCSSRQTTEHCVPTCPTCSTARMTRRWQLEAPTSCEWQQGAEDSQQIRAAGLIKRASASGG